MAPICLKPPLNIFVINAPLKILPYLAFSSILIFVSSCDQDDIDIDDVIENGVLSALPIAVDFPNSNEYTTAKYQLGKAYFGTQYCLGRKMYPALLATIQILDMLM